MRPRVVLLFFAINLAPSVFLSAAGTLVSGPMLGYSAHREALIWLETRDAQSVAIDYWIDGQPDTKRTITQTDLRPTPAGGQVTKFLLPVLTMGATYDYALRLDGAPLTFPYPLTFKTVAQWEWRTPPPDVIFLFGSCAYLNEPAYDRPGTPYGKGTEIFRHMADSGADFMIWDGDNWYLREADYDSVSGIWYRYSHDRATPDFQKLLAAMTHYATWDDHDYGPNDSNKSFAFKDVSLAAFKAYWGNPTFGEADNPGVYTKFYRSDAAFILLDDRYYRDDTTLDQDLNPNKSQYGARQFDWLKQSLLEAEVLRHYTFKFIVTGGQVLTTNEDGRETFAHFRRERAKLLQFIRDQGITGVVFLTGDLHYTELLREQMPNGQTLYDLTSSPFSSGATDAAYIDRARESKRVPGTLVDDQNYCTLALHGPKDDRVLTITCFDKTNTRRWTRDIKAAELR